MKRNSQSYLTIAIAMAIVTIFGCSKSDSGGGNPSDVTTANVSGSYKLTSIVLSIPPAPPIDYTDSVDVIAVCQRDDIYKLNTDLTYNYIDAGTQCSPPGDGTGSWKLIGTTKIVIDSDTADINSFTGTVLKISVTSTVSGITGTVTQTLTKQ